MEESTGDRKIACKWGSELLANMVECEDDVDWIIAGLEGEDLSENMKELISLLKGKDPDEGLELREEITQRLRKIHEK